MDINYYNNYYSPIDTQKEKDINKSQSQEATLRFREEYQISKEDYKDEVLEKKLNENGLYKKDICKNVWVINSSFHFNDLNKYIFILKGHLIRYKLIYFN